MGESYYLEHASVIQPIKVKKKDPCVVNLLIKVNNENDRIVNDEFVEPKWPWNKRKLTFSIKCLADVTKGKGDIIAKIQKGSKVEGQILEYTFTLRKKERTQIQIVGFPCIVENPNRGGTGTIHWPKT